MIHEKISWIMNLRSHSLIIWELLSMITTPDSTLNWWKTQSDDSEVWNQTTQASCSHLEHCTTSGGFLGLDTCWQRMEPFRCTVWVTNPNKNLGCIPLVSLIPFTVSTRSTLKSSFICFRVVKLAPQSSGRWWSHNDYSRMSHDKMWWSLHHMSSTPYATHIQLVKAVIIRAVSQLYDNIFPWKPEVEDHLLQ